MGAAVLVEQEGRQLLFLEEVLGGAAVGPLSIQREADIAIRNVRTALGTLCARRKPYLKFLRRSQSPYATDCWGFASRSPLARRRG